MESALLSTQLGVSNILKMENTPRTRRVCADAYKLWSYTFYPHHSDLAMIAERCATELGGSRLPLPGGKVLQKLSEIVGWRLAKQLHSMAYAFGYSKLPYFKRKALL
jgi:hypothetical protein